MINECLRKLNIDNPWPKEKPSVYTDPHGWFHGSDFIEDGCHGIVLELGVWLGTGTRWFAKHKEVDLVVSIDHFLGNPSQYISFHEYSKLPHLYKTFLKNCWKYKDKILPLKMTIRDGLSMLIESEIFPDLIFIDADHQYRELLDVLEQVYKYHELFGIMPVICGHDYNWKTNSDFKPELPIKRAVRRFAKINNMGLRVKHNVWRLEF